MITSRAKQKIEHLAMLTNHLLNINLTKALIWNLFSNELNPGLLIVPIQWTVKEVLSH